MSREFIELMTEIGFQICKLEDGTIDKEEFVQAINEIHEYNNTTILWKVKHTMSVSQWRNWLLTLKWKENKEVIIILKYYKYTVSGEVWVIEDTKLKVRRVIQKVNNILTMQGGMTITN